eukprot:TRINITY_DN3775_c0_g1_i1.p1 TRINITY_DN3775_c0_g1~~TRINITY_DN3775_c0_g1_i1.p1  ORF type:complete len:1884 (+),score=349.33 TRINITY_DN3775_c0_g1_i1:70-5721(+)
MAQPGPSSPLPRGALGSPQPLCNPLSAAPGPAAPAAPPTSLGSRRRRRKAPGGKQETGAGDHPPAPTEGWGAAEPPAVLSAAQLQIPDAASTRPADGGLLRPPSPECRPAQADRGLYQGSFRRKSDSPPRARSASVLPTGGGGGTARQARRHSAEPLAQRLQQTLNLSPFAERRPAEKDRRVSESAGSVAELLRLLMDHIAGIRDEVKDIKEQQKSQWFSAARQQGARPSILQRRRSGGTKRNSVKSGGEKDVPYWVWRRPQGSGQKKERRSGKPYWIHPPPTAANHGNQSGELPVPLFDLFEEPNDHRRYRSDISTAEMFLSLCWHVSQLRNGHTAWDHLEQTGIWPLGKTKKFFIPKDDFWKMRRPLHLLLELGARDKDEWGNKEAETGHADYEERKTAHLLAVDVAATLDDWWKQDPLLCPDGPHLHHTSCGDPAEYGPSREDISGRWLACFFTSEVIPRNNCLYTPQLQLQDRKNIDASKSPMGTPYLSSGELESPGAMSIWCRGAFEAALVAGQPDVLQAMLRRGDKMACCVLGGTGSNKGPATEHDDEEDGAESQQGSAATDSGHAYLDLWVPPGQDGESEGKEAKAVHHYLDRFGRSVLPDGIRETLLPDFAFMDDAPADNFQGYQGKTGVAMPNDTGFPMGDTSSMFETDDDQWRGNLWNKHNASTMDEGRGHMRRDSIDDERWNSDNAPIIPPGWPARASAKFAQGWAQVHGEATHVLRRRLRRLCLKELLLGTLRATLSTSGGKTAGYDRLGLFKEHNNTQGLAKLLQRAQWVLHDSDICRYLEQALKDLSGIEGGEPDTRKLCQQHLQITKSRSPVLLVRRFGWHGVAGADLPGTEGLMVAQNISLFQWACLLNCSSLMVTCAEILSALRTALLRPLGASADAADYEDNFDPQRSSAKLLDLVSQPPAIANVFTPWNAMLDTRGEVRETGGCTVATVDSQDTYWDSRHSAMYLAAYSGSLEPRHVLRERGWTGWTTLTEVLGREQLDYRKLNKQILLECPNGQHPDAAGGAAQRDDSRRYRWREQEREDNAEQGPDRPPEGRESDDDDADWECNACHVACQFGHTEVLQQLLQTPELMHGESANPTAKCQPGGYDALDVALMMQYRGQLQHDSAGDVNTKEINDLEDEVLKEQVALLLERPDVSEKFVNMNYIFVLETWQHLVFVLLVTVLILVDHGYTSEKSYWAARAIAAEVTGAEYTGGHDFVAPLTWPERLADTSEVNTVSSWLKQAFAGKVIRHWGEGGHGGEGGFPYQDSSYGAWRIVGSIQLTRYLAQNNSCSLTSSAYTTALLNHSGRYPCFAQATGVGLWNFGRAYQSTETWKRFAAVEGLTDSVLIHPNVTRSPHRPDKVKRSASELSPYNNLTNVTSVDWITPATRLVALEFVSYNVNSDRFVVSEVRWEITYMGEVLPSWRFTSVYLHTEKDYPNGIQMVYYLWKMLVVYFIVVELHGLFGEMQRARYKLQRQGGRLRECTIEWWRRFPVFIVDFLWGYLFDSGNIIDVINIALALGAWHELSLIDSLASDLSAIQDLLDPNLHAWYPAFVDLARSTARARSLFGVMALLGWISTTKFLRRLSWVGNIVYAITATFAAREVLAFLALLLVYLMGFWLCLYSAFGWEVEGLHSSWSTAVSTLRMFLGDMGDIYEMSLERHRPLATPVFVLMMLFITIFFLNILIAVISCAYEERSNRMWYFETYFVPEVYMQEELLKPKGPWWMKMTGRFGLIIRDCRNQQALNHQKKNTDVARKWTADRTDADAAPTDDRPYIGNFPLVSHAGRLAMNNRKRTRQYKVGEVADIARQNSRMIRDLRMRYVGESSKARAKADDILRSIYSTNAAVEGLREEVLALRNRQNEGDAVAHSNTSSPMPKSHAQH